MGEPATIAVFDGLQPDTETSLRPLFDSEYANSFGWWDPPDPYGYSPFDVHAVAYANGIAAGHVGFQRRTISVGGDDVFVGGTGGVLVAREHRRSGLGRQLMARIQETMRENPAVDFGYLGCREEVVDFYTACGWVRIRVDEQSVPRSRNTSQFHLAGAPVMICGAMRQANEWPRGTVDLQGRGW